MHTRNESIRLLLVDDHPVMRAGVRALLSAQPGISIVGEAGNGSLAIELASQLRPHLVLMDVSLPELSGAEATKRVVAAVPESRVLALSAHDDIAFVQSLLSSGAAGYALKRSASDELVRSVRIVAQGGSYVDPSLVDALVPSRARRRRVGSDPVSLSEREAEVVRLTARGHTSKEIAESLRLSPRTLETYKARAMGKLRLHSRADLIRYAMSSGWLRDI